MDPAAPGWKIDEAVARFERLRRDPTQIVHLDEALEELGVALEELRVTREEMRTQNEALAVSREEAERYASRYRELFEGAPCGYIITDPDGMVREANALAATMLGHTPDVLVGKPVAAMIPEEDRRRFLDALHTLRAQSRIENLPVSISCFQPMVLRFLLVSARTAHDPMSRIPTIRWALMDITPQRLAEARALNLDRQLWQRVAEETAALRAQVRVLENRLAQAEAGQHHEVPPDRPAV